MQNKRPKSGACFPKIRSVFPKPFICFAKQGRIAGANTTGGWIETTSHHHHSFILFCHFFQSFYYCILHRPASWLYTKASPCFLHYVYDSIEAKVTLHLSHIIQRLLVIRSTIDIIPHFLEYVIWRNSIKECHTGANLYGIYIAKYIYR